jgi:predicted PurR-regulated permease PerM
MNIDFGQLLLIAFALICVLPIVIVVIVGFMIYRTGQERISAFVSPDTEKINADFRKMKQANPKLEQKKLIRKIINQQALKAGVVGALTGFGGFMTLPIALPIDLALSLRIQATMVNFIALAYGHNQEGRYEKQVKEYLVMTGSSKVTQTSSRVLLQFLTRVIGKSMTRFIPVIGAVISFITNYIMVRVMGEAAVRWYSSREGAAQLEAPEA